MARFLRSKDILSAVEQEKLLAVAPPRIRMLTVLGVETGMRTGEMLGLRWTDVDLLECFLQVGQTKSLAGTRCVPFSKFCQLELRNRRNLVGPDYSELVFPSFSNRRHGLQGGRKAWASALKKAGIPFFPIYNLRHTFASRMTAAGVSSITIAQMLGHSSTQIVPRYAQVLDHNRLDAVRKMEAYRQQTIASGGEPGIDSPRRNRQRGQEVVKSWSVSKNGTPARTLSDTSKLLLRIN
jgi:integrase